MSQEIRNIKSWKQFAKHVRSKGCDLLSRLDAFPNSILVTGCQRSGTTILSRIVTQSEGMVDYWFGRDDELDAALILCGKVPAPQEGRYCFQTTYVNECYREYFEHGDDYRVIWVLRNPHSVVYSLLYHWKRWALNELFLACGTDLIDETLQSRLNTFGTLGVPKLIRACTSYNGKLSQLFELREKLGSSRIKVVEYDKLILQKKTLLPDIFDFLDLNYSTEYENKLHVKSIKKKNKLSKKEAATVEKLCLPVYEDALKLLDF